VLLGVVLVDAVGFGAVADEGGAGEGSGEDVVEGGAAASTGPADSCAIDWRQWGI
jgi:hypothetical protein